MNIIKRNGTEVPFCINNIREAIQKANNTVIKKEQLDNLQISIICNNVEEYCLSYPRALSVEEIQDIVENEIMEQQAFDVAKNYILYRHKRALSRKSNTTDEQILSLIDCINEDVKQENSNKNPVIVSVQRDYMAGESSKDLTKRILLDKDIVEAHEKGIIHFHDSDYFSQHMHNCCLIRAC